VQTMEKEDKIFRVLVPTEEVTEFKDGRKKVVQRKRFPGYVLVEMVMSDDSWYVVRNTPGVTGLWVPEANRFHCTEDEMRTILRQMGVEEPTVKVAFEIGETVRVVSGPSRTWTESSRRSVPNGAGCVYRYLCSNAKSRWNSTLQMLRSTSARRGGGVS